MITMRRPRIWLGGLALALAVGIGAGALLRAEPGPREAPEPIALTITPLLTEAQKGDTIGALRVVEAQQWQSSDARFGGWSDLRRTGDGAWLAISDQGYWLTVRDGAATMGAMRGPDGTALGSKRDADAEGLVILADGRAGVSFEGRHRIDLYSLAQDGYGAAAGAGPSLDGAARLGSNSGLEALALLPDGRLLAGAESGEVWVVTLAAASPAPLNQRLSLPLGWGLTAAAAIDSHLFLLWRFYNPLTEATMVDVRRCDLAGLNAPPLQCARLATLQAPFPVDNFEALDVAAHDGGYRLTLLSDDNYNRRQRTIFAVFDWAAPITPPPASAP
jgi:hypothetical protein